jgi:DNA-binding transcriptional regulator YhcF (GntR family)
VVLKSVRDYLRFLPFESGELFTTRELAEKAGVNAALARKAVYVLTKMQLAFRAGKRGNSFVYNRIAK